MKRGPKIVLLLISLYAFFVSISLLGESFEFLGEAFARGILATADNPFVGLFLGILATSIVQSSSTVTSMTVALVAGGALDLERAIPIVMGSNMGTSVTNAIVAAGQIGRPLEFRRAFGAAVVDDFFEIFCIAVLFPLQLATNFLGHASLFLAGNVTRLGGLTWANPLRTIVDPAIRGIITLTSESGLAMLVVALTLLVFALRSLVINLKVLLIGRVEVFMNEVLFQTPVRAMVLGFVLTTLVQSSSVTTSLAVPLAGIGALTLAQVFPYALGANLGTTTTAMMAALVTGREAAVAVAFSHFLYNVFGIALVWPVKWIPLRLAETLAAWSMRSKLVPVLYVAVVFFLIPVTLIYLAR